VSKFSIIPARALFDTRLDQEDVLLLVVLCQYTDKSGKCWPSFETIAETYSPLVGRTKTYSKASISAKMDRLEAAGYVRDGGHRKNSIGGYGTKDWYVLHDGEIPAEFDRSQRAEVNTGVQKTPPELNTSGQKTPIVSERNVPSLTVHTPTLEGNAEKEACWIETSNAFMGGLDGFAFQKWSDAWDKFPDKRRHDYSLKRALAANPRKFKFYLEDFYGYDPDKPKTWGEGTRPALSPRYAQQPRTFLKVRTD
jgi:hypothetical protein